MLIALFENRACCLWFIYVLFVSSHTLSIMRLSDKLNKIIRVWSSIWEYVWQFDEKFMFFSHSDSFFRVATKNLRSFWKSAL